MKKFVFVFIILSFALFLYSQESYNLFIRNSSEKTMNIRLIQKSSQDAVYEGEITRSRTQKVSNLQKGAYILYYKAKDSKEWRVMNVLVLTSEKTYVLF